MSEKLNIKFEQDNSGRKLEHEKHHERIEKKSEEDPNNNLEALSEKLELARNKINEIKSPVKSELIKESLESNDADDGMHWVSRELKTQAHNRLLSSVRNHLSPTEKKISKVIHRPLVENTSEAIGKTIARPSGILMGSIFSFTGSLVAYLIARKLGGEIKHSVFYMLFIVGFSLGLLIEIIWTFIAKRKSKK